MKISGILLLGLLAGASVTPGETVMQLTPIPYLADDPPKHDVQLDVRLAQTPGSADHRLPTVKRDPREQNRFLARALPLTHDRGTPGTDRSIANEVCERAHDTNSDNNIDATTKNDGGFNNSTGSQVMTTEHRDLVHDDAISDTAGGVCIDSNVCTDDILTPTGCVHVFNSNLCNDNSVCTTNDHCSNGSCIGTSINCNDSNDCTIDACNPLSGCVHVNNANSCNDGFFCNGRDTCNGGTCARHSGNPCLNDDPCVELTQECRPGALSSVISLKAVKRNNVALTPGTCNLAQGTPTCTTGNVNRPCASDAECHVGTSFLIPNTCAGGANISRVCSTNADCPGSTCISVLPGDLFETDIFLSRWGAVLPGGVRIFQAQINTAGYTSPDNGTVVPLGWCAPVSTIPCISSATCPPTFPNCSPFIGCMCAGHNPDLGAFITTSRKDFLLYGLDEIRFVDTSFIDYKYIGLAVDDSVQDIGFPRYLGSLMLKVSANACGTFVVGFVDEVNSTFIADSANPANQAFPVSQSLIVTVSNCPRQLLSCTPAHCNLDARIAHDRLDIGTKLNTDTIQMTYSKPTTDPNMVPADFEIALEPTFPGEVLPEISSVTPYDLDPKQIVVLLSRPIQQTRWTCIRDKASNKRCCLGSLPADADFNRISNTNDIFELLDNLLGGVVPHLVVEKCDTDRSSQCTPADLLMAVDLLTGADAFTEVNGDSMPPCPAMRPPQ